MLGFGAVAQGALSQASFNVIVNTVMSGDATSTVSATAAATFANSGTITATASNTLTGQRARTDSGTASAASSASLSAAYTANTQYSDIPGESGTVSITPEIIFEGIPVTLEAQSGVSAAVGVTRVAVIDVLQSLSTITLTAREKWEAEAEGTEVWVEVTPSSDNWTEVTAATNTWTAVTNDSNAWVEQADATNTWTEVQ